MNTNFRTTDLDTVAPKGTNFVTMYVVRDAYKRQFLNQPTYTGRARGRWSVLDGAYLFQTAKKASSCASNIAQRQPGCRRPQVRPVLVARKAP